MLEKMYIEDKIIIGYVKDKGYFKSLSSTERYDFKINKIESFIYHYLNDLFLYLLANLSLVILEVSIIIYKPLSVAVIFIPLLVTGKILIVNSLKYFHIFKEYFNSNSLYYNRVSISEKICLKDYDWVFFDKLIDIYEIKKGLLKKSYEYGCYVIGNLVILERLG